MDKSRYDRPTTRTPDQIIEDGYLIAEGRMASRYDIANQFSEGFAAALIPRARSLSESDHWIAGYDAGYRMRKEKNTALNEYITRLGHEPMAIITLAGASGGDVVKWYTWEQVSRSIHDGDIWWHDNGDQIYPVNIAWSPTSESFFATLGQWGWTRAQDLSEMGGLWTPCVEPCRSSEVDDGRDG